MAGLKAGAIFEQSKHGYVCKMSIDRASTWVGYPKEIVELEPEWFEEVVDKKCPSCGIQWHGCECTFEECEAAIRLDERRKITIEYEGILSVLRKKIELFGKIMRVDEWEI